MTMELKKLSEESLTRQPEEVFDILSKLGEGSYGSVFKALHKESGQVLAIKQVQPNIVPKNVIKVPVDTDLQEIIKEISIMQQCDSPYVVKYYGSYFKNTDLWIVMEYCGGGSVLDTMKLRGMSQGLKKGEVCTLTEAEIATVLSDTLKGLEYLHLRKKIHRDIKAGNILLNLEGHAKLADFGVAGQLTDTMAKRNTMIGTPFWMAPEVIQEIGHDCVADIWSLGITALEMAEGKAPYGDIHPMRAIFMIPSKPPPSFSKPDKWSPQFIDFVSRCLVKNPEERATASQLLHHEFIANAGKAEILTKMIAEAKSMRDKLRETHRNNKNVDSNVDLEATLVPSKKGLKSSGVPEEEESDSGTMIQHDTLLPDFKDEDPKDGSREVEVGMGTMVINEGEDNTLNTTANKEDVDEDEDTMKRHSSKEYRPAFLAHFDKRPEGVAAAVDDSKLEQNLERIAGNGNVINGQQMLGQPDKPDEAQVQSLLLEGDLNFLKYMSYEELLSRMANLDVDMEREIDNLRRRYHAKRQPILDAMDQKRKKQQNF